MREPAYKNLAKRERLMMQRDKTKREQMLGGILSLSRLPDAMFIVDIGREHIAIHEALRLNIPIIAMVDTNCNPALVDYPIPANDDSSKSIELITESLSAAIARGAGTEKTRNAKHNKHKKKPKPNKETP